MDETNNKLDSLGSSLINIGDWLTQGFGNVISKIEASVTTIVNSIASIPQLIVDKLQGLLELLFIPSDEFWNNRFDNIISKFDWIEDLKDSVMIIVGYFTDKEFSIAPKVTINLDMSKSKYDYGSEAIIVDLSWYADYRDVVQRFMRAFMWLFFIWNTFRSLPSIISGVGTGGDNANNIIDYDLQRGFK